MSKRYEFKVGQKIGKWIIMGEAPSGSRGNARWRCKCVCGTERDVDGIRLRNGRSLSCGCIRNKQTSDNKWKGVGGLSSVQWSTIKRCAHHRNLEIGLSMKDAWELFVAQQGKCALTGLPIELYKRQTKNRRIGTASLDRIDSTKGYVIENVQWVHKEINKMKMELPQDRFFELCKLVVSHLNVKDNVLYQLEDQVDEQPTQHLDYSQ